MLGKLNELLNKIFRSKTKQAYFEALNIAEIEAKLNYTFQNQDLIIQALKHRSYLTKTNEDRLHSNERLELLGDAVLGMVVIEYLYNEFPQKEEGELTAIKSLIVSRKILASIARKIGLGKYILMNEAEEKAGGRNRSSILSDVFESITGAIYLDGGLATVEKFIGEKILCHTKEIISIEQYRNFKSMLLEYAQGNSLGVPKYVVSREDGPDHDKRFTIEVLIDEKVLGSGRGNSKKKAEQIAAKNALKKINLI